MIDIIFAAVGMVGAMALAHVSFGWGPVGMIAAGFVGAVAGGIVGRVIDEYNDPEKYK